MHIHSPAQTPFPDWLSRTEPRSDETKTSRTMGEGGETSARRPRYFNLSDSVTPMHSPRTARFSTSALKQGHVSVFIRTGDVWKDQMSFVSEF